MGLIDSSTYWADTVSWPFQDLAHCSGSWVDAFGMNFALASHSNRSLRLSDRAFSGAAAKVVALVAFSIHVWQMGCCDGQSSGLEWDVNCAQQCSGHGGLRQTIAANVPAWCLLHTCVSCGLD